MPPPGNVRWLDALYPVEGLTVPSTNFSAEPSEEQRLYYIHHFLDELKLLDKRDLQRLFPEATILSEHFLGLVKSNIAVRL